MNNGIMGTLETLEEKIENIKWLITPYSYSRRKIVPDGVGHIRRTAGILGKSFISGIVYENRIRKEWGNNTRKRI